MTMIGSMSVVQMGMPVHDSQCQKHIVECQYLIVSVPKAYSGVSVSKAYSGVSVPDWVSVVT